MAGRGGLRRVGADDALERRRGVGRRRGPRADPPRRVRPGGGRAGRLVVRPAARRAPPAVLRHGRHDGQVLPHRGRRARAHEHVRGGPHLPVQEGLGLPGLGAVGRPRRDRRRRRQPGPRRRARPAEGRARSRPAPTPARPATAAAAREPAVTDADLLLGLLDAGYFLGGDMPLDAAEPPTARRPRSPTALGLRRRRHRGRRARASSTRTWPPPPACTPSSRASTCAASPLHRLRRRRARCTPAGWPSCSSRRPGDLPGQRQRAVGLRHARSRRCASTSPASMVRRARRHRRRRARRGARRAARPRARGCSRAAGVPADAVRFRYGVDARYAGQGNEITVWVGEGEAWPATATRVAARFDEEYERIYGLTIPDVGVEAVTWRLSALRRRRRRSSRAARPGAERRRGRRTATGRSASTAAPAPSRRPVYRRDALGAGAPLRRAGHRRGARDHRGHPPGLVASRSATDGSLVATRRRSAP